MSTWISSLGNLITPKNIMSNTGSVSIRYENYGRTFVLTGSTVSTFTLQTIAAVPTLDLQFPSIGIICNTTSNALLTLIPQTAGGVSRTLQGQSSVVIGSGDSLVVTNDGTNYFINNLSLSSADFRAYLSSNATLPATGSSLTVLFDTEVRDIGSFYATGTGIWTPLLPGVGGTGGQVIVDFDGSENTVITCQLQKNGSAISTDIQQGISGSARKIRLSVGDGNINFNGSTDNYKIVISQTGANTQSILGTIDQTFFYGSRRGLF